MKPLIHAAALALATFAALLAFSAPAFALCDDWSRQDTVLEAAGQALLAVDWAQSRVIAASSRPELNPALGSHPSSSKVNQYFAVFAAVNLSAACLLSPHWRGIFMGFTIGIETQSTWNNHAAGIRVAGIW